MSSFTHITASTPITAPSPTDPTTPQHFDDRHITFYEDDDCSNLSSSQQHLLQQHRKVVEDRKREQEMQKLEIQRLDAILKMCEHYANANAFSLQKNNKKNEAGEIRDEVVANSVPVDDDDEDADDEIEAEADDEMNFYDTKTQRWFPAVVKGKF